MLRKKQTVQIGKDRVGDAQFLVFAVGSATIDFATNDYKRATIAAENRAKNANAPYEVYAKIGRAEPVKHLRDRRFRYFLVFAQGR